MINCDLNSRTPRRNKWLLPLMFMGLCFGLSNELFSQTFDVSTEAELINAISSANNGSVININQDIVLTSELQRIDKDLTFNGNGNSINGNNQVRPFFIDQGTVEFNNIRISGGLHTGRDGNGGGGGGMGAGGAIFVNRGAFVRVIDVIFESNSATGGNGGSGEGGDGGSFEEFSGGQGAVAGAGETRTGEGSNYGGGGGGAVATAGGIAAGGSAGFGGGAGGAIVRFGGTASGGEGGFGGGGGGAFAEGSGTARGGDAANRGGADGGSAGSTGSGIAIAGEPANRGDPGTGPGGSGGGGGAGLGGAVFVRRGGTLEVHNGVQFQNNSVFGGLGGSNGGGDGYAEGADLYIQNGSLIYVDSDDPALLASIIGGGYVLQTSETGTRTIDGYYDFEGVTAVNSGNLVVDGTVTGEVFVAAGGTLSGNGTIGILSINGGTVSPGGSIGTLTVTRTMDAVDGTFIIEISPGGNTPGVHNDFINVHRTATVSGGQVVVQAFPGTYQDGTRYTFIEAADGFSGTFDSIVDDLPLLDAELGYSPTSAYFTLVRNQVDLTSVILDADNRELANYFDRQPIVDGSDFQLVMNTLAMMNRSQINDSFQQITGSIYQTNRSFSVISSNLLHRSIASRLRTSLTPNVRYEMIVPKVTISSRSSESHNPFRTVNFSKSNETVHSPNILRKQAFQWKQWSLAFGQSGTFNGSSLMGESHFQLGGFCTGLERHIDWESKIGFFAGYSNGTTRGRDGNERVEVDTSFFGALASKTNGRSYGLLSSTFQHEDFSSRRNLSIGNLQRTAKADYSGWRGSIYSELGNRITAGGLTLQPHISLQYGYGKTDRIIETDAGSLSLQIDPTEGHSLIGGVGGSVGWNPQNKRWLKNFSTEIRGQYRWDLLEEDDFVSAGLEGGTGPGFRSPSLDIGKHWASAGMGVKYRLNDRLKFRLDYDLQFNDSHRFHSATGQVEFSW